MFSSGIRQSQSDMCSVCILSTQAIAAEVSIRCSCWGGRSTQAWSTYTGSAQRGNWLWCLCFFRFVVHSCGHFWRAAEQILALSLPHFTKQKSQTMDGAWLFSAIKSLVQGPHRNATSKSRALYQPLADKFKGSKDTWQLQDGAEDTFWADVSGKNSDAKSFYCSFFDLPWPSMTYYDLYDLLCFYDLLWSTGCFDWLLKNCDSDKPSIEHKFRAWQCQHLWIVFYFASCHQGRHFWVWSWYKWAGIYWWKDGRWMPAHASLLCLAGRVGRQSRDEGHTRTHFWHLLRALRRRRIGAVFLHTTSS